jgi:hypothetical protein
MALNPLHVWETVNSFTGKKQERSFPVKCFYFSDTIGKGIRNYSGTIRNLNICQTFQIKENIILIFESSVMSNVK